MGKPSVVGAGALAIDEREKTVKIGAVTLKEGDKITVFGWQARDGTPWAHSREVTFSDGKKLFFGPPAGTGDGGALPAVDLWESLTGTDGVFAFHLFLLAHPPPLPERMLGAAPSEFFGHFLDVWVRDPAAIPPPVREAYLSAASTPEAIAAVCADYRASATVDVEHDTADRAAGRRLAMPVAALWQRPVGELPFDPAAVWGSWAPDLRTHVLDCGHFLPEERPEEVVAALRKLIAV